MKSKGQALLPLLIVLAISLSLGLAAIELSISNLIVSRYFQDEIDGYYLVESALENGLLQLLRNPAYTGEDLQLAGASCTITVTGDTPQLMVAECDDGRQVRKVQAQVNYTDGVMEVSQVEEVE